MLLRCLITVVVRESAEECKGIDNIGNVYIEIGESEIWEEHYLHLVGNVGEKELS